MGYLPAPVTVATPSVAFSFSNSGVFELRRVLEINCCSSSSWSPSLSPKSACSWTIFSNVPSLRLLDLDHVALPLYSPSAEPVSFSVPFFNFALAWNFLVLGAIDGELKF